MQNKKAQIFNGMLVIITLIVLITALLAIDAKNKKLEKQEVGKKQFELFKTYTQAEKDAFYIEQSAKLSAKSAAMQLAEKAGYIENPECGITKDNIILWKNSEKECYPDNYVNNYKTLINNELKTYLALYPNKKISNINHEFSFIKENIVGIAKNQLYYLTTIPLRIEYYLTPSFNIDINYNVDEYLEVWSFARNLAETCKDRTDKDECIQSEKFASNLNFINCRAIPKENTFYFCIQSENKEIVYKFALIF
jgi:hypothetical protein